MYKDYYGLIEYPFNLTPDPKFLVTSSNYKELLAGLYYGIQMARGLMVLTGEVGTGKTTAMRWVIRRLDTGVLASYIFNPHLSIEEFYHYITGMLGVKQWSNKSELLSQFGELLDHRHQRGLRTILIVDEAHELSDEVLEEIRLLLNFESDNAKHLQVVLVGQPELTERLRQPNLRQLKQRVAFRCKLPVLAGVEEVRHYIIERLKIAGAVDTDLFTDSAVEFIFQCSGGIPRQINNLCDNALLYAFSSDTRTIDRRIVEEVAASLDMLPDQSLMIGAETSLDLAPKSRVLTEKGRGELISPDDDISNISERDFGGLPLDRKHDA
ncbi:MAG TPA: AAA family ATPase [Pyrinomonadaceae bacterium]|nr:AAA family ATPase [Pyrinomonadaceae bacterium]